MKQFNLTILQLVLPLASMTKSEYKEAYGIDLDDIDIEKVTLVQEEGSKNKYFVDEIKIVSDDVLIFAGGKVLTIGDDGNVSVTNNAYSVENSKPLYFHPITIYKNTSAYKCLLSLFIINNNDEAFTPETLLSYLQNVRGRYLLNGNYYTSTFYLSPTIVARADAEGSKFCIIGVDSTGTIHSETSNTIDFEALLGALSSIDFADDVNKIN